MKTWMFGTGLVVALCFAGCSSSSQTSNAPTPTDPTANGSSPINVPATTSTDTTLLSTPYNLVLSDTTTYQGLKDITLGDFFPVSTTGSQIVGNPTIEMLLTNSTTPTGQVQIKFEDYLGAWVTKLNSFNTVSRRSGNNLDLIFADNDKVFRIGGTVSSDSFVGGVYYRIRANGDTQCKMVTITGTCYANGFPYACAYPSPDVNSICQAYMATSQTTVVKTLGTFQATFSKWLK